MTGDTVLVTGTASGIGAAIASRLLGDGLRVCGWDLGPSVGDLAETPGYEHAIVDVTDDDAVWMAVAAFNGRLRGVVHAAGIFHAPARIAQTPPDLVDRVLRVNVTGTMNLLRHALPALANTENAVLVNIASESALQGSPGIAVYAASKAAVVSLTRTAALEYASRGVRVVAVAPGATRTPMLGQLGDGGAEQLARSVPLGRLAEPDDVAGVVAFLLGPDAHHITGEVIAVNGGATA